MKTVYILVKTIPYAADEIIGVYESEDVADKVADAFIRNDSYNRYTVQHWAVE